MAARLLSPAELASNRTAVLATYRHLRRAIYIAFKGDIAALESARTVARENFRKNRKLEPGNVNTAQAIEHAQGVAQILRENVVQGRLTAEDTYKLNIHEHTQRLDNGTASKLKGTKKSFAEIKNAQL